MTYVYLDSLKPDTVKALCTPNHRPKLQELTLFVSTLRSDSMPPTSLANLTSILEMCLSQLIAHFEFDLFSHNEIKCNTGTSAVAGIELLQLCYTLQLPSFVDRALARFLVVPRKQNEETYIKRGLVPVVKALPEFLQSQQLSLMDAPFSEFVSTVVKNLVRPSMRTKPGSNEVSLVSNRKSLYSDCCGVCDTHLKPFLASKRQTARVKAVQNVRSHLMQRLNVSGATTLGFTYKTIETGKPYTLEVNHGPSYKPQSAFLLTTHGRS